MEGERVVVLAFSGGAAAAYACGTYLPERIATVGIVSGATWPVGPPPPDDLLRSAADALSSDPGAAVAGLAADAYPLDRLALADPDVDRRLRDGAADAVAGGVEGWVTDGRLTRAPWPFDPADVGVPVRLWHGLLDDIVPVREARAVRDALPRGTLKVIPDAGHLGWMTQEVQIISELLNG